jgi:phosphatidylinositol glycan class C protein
MTGLILIGDPGARTVKASLLVFLALIALAPILRTLTAPTSADSISALTTALFLVHAALADYSYAASPVRRERCVSFLLFWRISRTHRVGKD